MKKHLFIALTAVLSLFMIISCEGWFEKIEPDTTSVTIKNLSRYTIEVSLCGIKKTCLPGGVEVKFVNGTDSLNLPEGAVYVYLQYNKSVDEPDVVCRLSDPIIIEKNKDTLVSLTDNNKVEDTLDANNKGTIATLKSATTLTIKNSSSFDLKNVSWREIEFSSHPIEPVLERTTEKTASVDTGYGYLYFTRKNDDAILRSKDVINIKTRGTDEVYEIMDSMIVMEIHNETNSGTLEDIQKKVVFFDDADGDLYPYTQRVRTSYSSYITSKYELHSGKYLSMEGNYVSTPSDDITDTNGSYAILSFDVDMADPGALSFWYSSYSDYTSERMGLKIFVDGNIEKRFGPEMTYSWATSSIHLDSGKHTIVLKTWCGGTERYNTIIGTHFFALDDLMIVYDE